MVSQIRLVTAIFDELAKQKHDHLVPRQINTVISAANWIIAELNRTPLMAKDGVGLKLWLVSDDVGSSSKYLASVLGGFDCKYAHPHDLDDFMRCVRLFIAVPEFRGRLHEMKDKSKQWSALVDSWTEIESLVDANQLIEANARVARCVVQ